MTMTKQDFENKARTLATELIAYATERGKQYGITDVAVGIGHNEKVTNAIENGMITKDVSGSGWDVGVTIYAGKRRLAFSTNTLDIRQICASIDQNMQVIHLVPEDKFAGLLEKEKLYRGTGENLDKVDNNPPTRERLIDYGRKMAAAALQTGIKTVEAEVEATHGYSLMMATNGLYLLNEGTSSGAGVQAIAEKNGKMEYSYDFSLARHFNDMAKPEEVGHKAAQKALAKLGSALPDSQQATIILSPEAASTFFSSVISAINGEPVYREETFLKDKMGQQVMNAAITIEDDPRIPGTLNSQITDNTGMESKKIVFVDQGVLRSFNVSLVEARQLGIEPIGRNKTPGNQSGLTNLRVLPGTQSPEELMADIKDGFYIRGFQGGMASAINGVFSRPAYGHTIKDGKITGDAVSGFVVAGNLQQMFMSVTVANDTPRLPDPRHTAAVPTARIDGIKIAGR